MFSFLRSSLLWSQTVGLGVHGCSVLRMAQLLRANLTPNLWLFWSFLNLTRVGSDGRVLFWGGAPEIRAPPWEPECRKCIGK